MSNCSLMMMMMIVQKLDFSYFFPRHFNAQEVKISCALLAYEFLKENLTVNQTLENKQSLRH